MLAVVRGWESWVFSAAPQICEWNISSSLLGSLPLRFSEDKCENRKDFYFFFGVRQSLTANTGRMTWGRKWGAYWWGEGPSSVTRGRLRQLESPLLGSVQHLRIELSIHLHRGNTLNDTCKHTWSIISDKFQKKTTGPVCGWVGWATVVMIRQLLVKIPRST